MGWNASERAEMNVVGRCPGRVAGAGRLRFSALTGERRFTRFI